MAYANAAGYGLGAQAAAYAARFLGVPYVWGGASPAGFDCSGLVLFVYQHLGVKLPRTSQEQAKVGIPVSKADLQPGDLVFYNEPGEGTDSHVAIYAGGGEQIAAPHTGAKVSYQPVDWAHFSHAMRVAAGSASPAGATPAEPAGAFGPPGTGGGIGSSIAGGIDRTVSLIKALAVLLPFLVAGGALVVWGLTRGARGGTEGGGS